MFHPSIAIGHFPEVIVEIPARSIQVAESLVERVAAFVAAIFDAVRSWIYSTPCCNSFSYSVTVHRNKKFDLHPDPLILLTFDGGGVRGIASLKIAEIFEREIQGQLKDATDALGGTSTGAIIVGGLAQGLTAVQLIEYYNTFAQKVFSTSLLHRISSLWGAIKAKYTSIGPLLRTIIQDKPLTTSQAKNLYISCVDIATDETVIFDNTMENVSFVDAIEASAAAPTYFPSKIVNGRNLMDGGMAENNPIQDVVLRAIESVDADRPILAISVGTGRVEPDFKESPKVVDEGYLQLAPKIIDIEFDTKETQTDKTMAGLAKIRPNFSYVRIQMKIPAAMAQLDNADPANMKKLEEIGTHCGMHFLNNGGRERVIVPMKDKLAKQTLKK